MMTLPQLARVLGGIVAGSSVLCPGPGHSPRDRSLSVTPSATAEDGYIVFSHAGDDWRACREHVRQRIGHGQVAHRRIAEHARSNLAGMLWEKSVDPTQIVRDYHTLRGLTLPDDVAGRVVRFHQRCPWRGDDGLIEYRPAMICAFRRIIDDRLVAVHRVALAPDGTKIGRKMLGPVGGAAIKVDDDTNVEQGLFVGEGYETALAGRLLGFRPVWALGSAVAIATMPVLAGIDALTLLAETDDSGANARGARMCARAWRAAGREAYLVVPGIAGDINDVLVLP
jgi:hypothetical protein